MGFCGDVIDGRPSHVDDFIPNEGMVTADEFVDWVLNAEGMDLAGEDAKRHRGSLRDAFVRHMGGTVVDAKLLGWRFG